MSILKIVAIGQMGQEDTLNVILSMGISFLDNFLGFVFIPKGTKCLLSLVFVFLKHHYKISHKMPWSYNLENH